MQKIAVALLTLVLFVCALKGNVSAQENTQQDFSIGYDVRYEVDENFEAKVIKKGLLTNLSASKYLPSVNLEFNSPLLVDLHAYDDLGLITPQLTHTATQSSVILPFNKPILGIGKKLSYTIEYKNTDIYSENDTEKIIKLPKITNEPYVVSYNVTLTLPESLGKPTFVDPPLRTKEYYWEKDQIESRGITLIFPKLRNSSETSAVNSTKEQKSNTASETALIVGIVVSLIVGGVFVGFHVLKKRN